MSSRPTFALQWHALRVAAWQVAFAALAATAIAAFAGIAAGAAALLGGAIAGCGSLAYAIAFGGPRLEPKRVLRAHLRAEALKLSISIAGLAVALGNLSPQAAWPLIAGFVVALHGYFAALWLDRS